MTKQRFDYLDYAKALGILFIVFEHVAQYFNVFGTVNRFGNFRVSIFFFVSGGLFLYTKEKQISYKEYLNKKIKSLIVPYVIFSIINSMMKLGVLLITHKLNARIVEDEMRAFFITGNGTVWFLLTLFLVEVLFFYINKKDNLYLNAVIALVALIIPFAVAKTYNNIFIVGLRVAMGMFYYIVGFYCMKEVWKKEISLHIGIILAIIGAVLSYFAGSESYFGGYYNKILVTVPSILIGIFGWIIIFKNIKTKLNLLSYLGKNSLIIMLVHPIILLFFTYPFSKKIIGLSFSLQLIVGTALFLIIMILHVPCIYIINNHMPFLIGKTKK